MNDTDDFNYFADTPQEKGTKYMLELIGVYTGVSLCEKTGLLTVTDIQSGTVYHQIPAPEPVVIRNARVEHHTCTGRCTHPEKNDDSEKAAHSESSTCTGHKIICYEAAIRNAQYTLNVQIEIDERGDIILSLDGDFSFSGEISYPGAFKTQPGDIALLPMDEGMAFPVEDPNILVPESRPTYSGWGHSMQFWAMTRKDGFLIAHFENCMDAIIRDIRSQEGTLTGQISWIPQLRKWGYKRKIRYITGTGGIVGAMKNYRQLMKEKGYLVTLREKSKTAPNIEKIIGAANFWLWDVDVKKITSEMIENGIDKVLWSRLQSKEDVAYLRDETDYLVGRYDIYRDIPTPAIIERWSDKERETPEEEKTYMLHPSAYPDDVVIDENGSLLDCWKIRYEDGTEAPMACMCGTMYPKHAAIDVVRDSKNKGYEARFVDTVTAAEFVECYSPHHPATRETEGKWRLRAVEMMSDFGLVTGVENMMDFAVPYVHYSEGLMSPGIYRRKDAGYYFREQYYGDDVDAVIRDFQLNPIYRAPLWELVFHDCLINYWYWGDNSVTCPELTARRDVFNALYGTLPLYSVMNENWEKMKDLVFTSYQRATKVAKLTGYDELIDFTYLTSDKKVQRTLFANGIAVIANLSDANYICEDGWIIEPDDYRITGG